MWLALAKLEDYDKAKEVLNNSINANMTDRSIWISAANLEEANGNPLKTKDIIRKAVKKMSKLGVSTCRQQWL